MKIKIKSENIWLFGALLVLLSEKVLWHPKGILYYGYYLAALAIFLFSVFLGRKLFVKDYGIMMIVICQSWLVCSNMINGSTYLTTIISLNTISLCLLMVYGIKKNNSFIIILANTLMLLCIVDQIWVLYQIIVTHKSAVGGYGIFLHKNAHGIMYIGAILFQYLKYKKTSNTIPIKLKVYIAFCFIISAFVLKSASSSVAIFAVIALMICDNKIIAKYYNVLTLLLIDFFLFITIVIKRMDSFILSYIVENILNRNLNFTGRAAMWDDTLAQIINLPFWGYGDDFLCVQREPGIVRYTNCHNYILHVIVSGGWVYALMVLMVYIICYYRMRGYENTASGRVVMYYLTANAIIGISEIIVNMSILLFPILMMGINIKELEEGNVNMMEENNGNGMEGCREFNNSR